MDKITTLDMEIRLMSYFGIRRNIVVPNVSWGLSLHECDLLVLTPSNCLTEVEIKVSKSDLIADKKKHHNHYNNKISRLYFAITADMIDCTDLIPLRAGILVASNVSTRTDNEQQRLPNTKGREWFSGIRKIREAELNKYAVKIDKEVRYDLCRLGTMRILGLKRQINSLLKNKDK